MDNAVSSARWSALSGHSLIILFSCQKKAVYYVATSFLFNLTSIEFILWTRSYIWYWGHPYDVVRRRLFFSLLHCIVLNYGNNEKTCQEPNNGFDNKKCLYDVAISTTKWKTKPKHIHVICVYVHPKKNGFYAYDCFVQPNHVRCDPLLWNSKYCFD